MIEILRLISGLIATSVAGWVILRVILFKEKRPLLEEIALSYGLGMGALALEFVLFWSVGIRPTIANILLPWFFIGVFLFFTKGMPREAASLGRVKERYSVLEKFFICGISLEVFLSFFRALIKPIESSDAVAIYAIRAKVFYEAGGIPGNFFSDITNAFPNSGYPIMVPLMENWAFKLSGAFNDFLVKLIFPLFFAALVIIFYFALREFFDRRRSLLFTFLLATVPQLNAFSSVGYADFILTFYFTAGFIYLFGWMKNKNTRYLILSALLTAFGCWTKMEGWALFSAAIITFVIFITVNFKKEKRTLLKLGIFSLVVLLIALPWIFLIRTTHLEDQALKFDSFGFGRIISSFFNFDRCPRIIYEFQKQFFGPKKWNILWILFLALFFINLKNVFRGDMKYITIMLVSIMVLYGYAYLLIPLEEGSSINWIIGSALSRLFIHFTPLAVFWLAYLSKEKRYV